MIRLEGLTKRFGRGANLRRVIKGASLTLPDVPGLALIGRNGAGKSTLLRMIAGTIAPDHGRVVTDEHISWPLGFAGGFHPALTGAQNARFVARINGRDPRALSERVEEFAELDNAWCQPFRTYSSGMKARLAFAVSMAIEFDTYLVDEIIGVGDARFRRKCHAAFRARMGRARLLMVSHNEATLREFCQAALVLEAGRLSVVADMDEALARHEANMAA